MNAAGKIRVLLVDDHSIVRGGLRAVLGYYPQVEVVGEAADGQAALAAARRLKPDVVLLDISMPGMGGLETAARLRKESPKSRTIILSVHAEAEYVRQMARSGAKGYLVKDARPEDIFRAIHEVDSGRTYFSPKISEVLAREVVEGVGTLAARRAGLTARETEVLALVAEGHSSKAIAARLNLSQRTIETYRDRIMAKLDIHNAAGLTRYAIAQGLVRA